MPITKDLDHARDEELVKLSLKNQDNFLYLVNRYQNRLLIYIRRLTNISLEDAEDILQDVFIKVYLNLNAFKNDLKFSSWIYRIVHNEVISQHRKLQARPEGYQVNLDENLTRNLATDIDIIGSVDLKILRTNIFKILNSLPKKYREVLILKFLEEKNYREISDIIKRPLGTVASLINRAKREFRTELTKTKIIL